MFVLEQQASVNAHFSGMENFVKFPYVPKTSVPVEVSVVRSSSIPGIEL